jgi:hypothetical protein
MPENHRRLAEAYRQGTCDPQLETLAVSLLEMAAEDHEEEAERLTRGPCHAREPKERLSASPYKTARLVLQDTSRA